MLPGFVPPACHQKVPCEQGRAVGFKRRLVGPAKPKRRERSNDPAAVRLADSTPRLGEPTTWGSGQRVLSCSKATWPPCNGRYGHPFKGMNTDHGNRTRANSREIAATKAAVALQGAAGSRSTANQRPKSVVQQICTLD